MFRVYLLFGAVVLARAQIPSLGFCPEYLPMADFDIDSFLGKWYEAERYFQFTEVTSRCVVTDYAKGPSGKIYVSNEVTSRLTGIKRIIDGYLELSGRSGEGKFNVKYTTTPLSSQATLTVLETDYDNYAVLWSCSGFGPIHTQSVWAMTRERLPPGEVLQRIYGVLDKYKISRNFFVKTDQEGCALAASDINAANGITVISTVAEATGIPQRKTPVSNKKKVTVKGESAQSDNTDTGAVKSVDPNLEPVNSLDENFKSLKSVIPLTLATKSIIPEAALPEVIIPEATVPESVNSEVVKNVPFASEPIKIDIIENPVAKVPTESINEILKTVSNSETELQPKIAETLAQDGLKPLQIAEVILQDKPIEPCEGNENLLKTQNVPVIEQLAVIASENVPVPEIVEVFEESITPVKAGTEDKAILTETKTNY